MVQLARTSWVDTAVEGAGAAAADGEEAGMGRYGLVVELDDTGDEVVRHRQGEPKRAEQDTVRGVSLDAIRKFQSEQSHIGDSLQHKLMMSAIFRCSMDNNTISTAKGLFDEALLWWEYGRGLDATKTALQKASDSILEYASLQPQKQHATGIMKERMAAYALRQLILIKLEETDNEYLAEPSISVQNNYDEAMLLDGYVNLSAMLRYRYVEYEFDAVCQANAAPDAICQTSHDSLQVLGGILDAVGPEQQLKVQLTMCSFLSKLVEQEAAAQYYQEGPEHRLQQLHEVLTSLTHHRRRPCEEDEQLALIQLDATCTAQQIFIEVLKQLKYVLHKRRANGASDRHKVQSLFKIARHLAGHASYMTQDTSHYREALKYIEGAIELQRSYRGDDDEYLKDKLLPLTDELRHKLQSSNV